ncbi:NAD-dependent epimerase/dehydratase family protein [Roseomonas rosulenta]|uniref:NAD-dependent epimerase/dehydratase family protein n=1 Tax=Roseomonas rosulenta TaxID=2748667 RepID=UPI0018E03147|nr:NAD-dependent epimerase/dehydratase family protein [Roseomonas rosulenta]
MRRVCIVGAGVIAATHAEALSRLPGINLAAVVDPDEGAAARLAATWRIGQVYRSVTEALDHGAIDAAHILVPPPLHAEVARPFLEAGKAVLVEKPLAVTTAACEMLRDTAQTCGAVLAVNQNFLFHPAFLQLRKQLSAGRFGPPRSVACTYAMPLRQLAARQFGHWMFHAPGNILLEQAVHPLSQILALAGAVRDIRAIAEPAREISPGVAFHAGVTASLDCVSLPAHLSFAVGRQFPVWQVAVVCDDGVITADMVTNRVWGQGRTRWVEPVDNLASGLRTASAMVGASVRNLARFGVSTLGLAGRSDPFFQSMRGSIAAFHAALSGGAPFPADAGFGTALVQACERISAQAFAPPPPARLPRPALLAVAGSDVALIGGTGFIGSEVARRLIDEGRRVSVLARNVTNLPAPFDRPEVELHRGDMRDRSAVERAIGSAPVVINLAHGGGGGSFEAIRAAMLGGAEGVAQACMAASVRRMIHVGSIASLYCGAEAGTITGATPPDPEDERRADYARAKILCDRLLMDLHAQRGLPVVILRPGLVLGPGTSPFHSGLGFFNNEQHCIGWNAGRNPLPFVLVQDVAAAILLAASAEGIEGHCYNLVGDVRPSAREFIAQLAQATGRPLRFHPKAPDLLLLEEGAKWLLKRLGGRRGPAPSRRDLLSRGLRARFDCDDAKRDLGWRPVGDAREFMRLALGHPALD